ncbi:hypothetical protein M422DRAFT_54173 [Sphaerobolus stellatus SS14]|uniref:Uncharacterized protein n=1 Tax=Sphaerobolus stellatus (strain SS14) TaxID=990650 RepID=A0A0C9TIM8_SPHS4|nr:hypothetical protein M422DRAFT_54173 [Sphaerobolus stellatus SS14]
MGSDNREQCAVFWDEVSDKDWEIIKEEEERKEREKVERRKRKKEASKPMGDESLLLKELITKPDSLMEEARAAHEVQKKRVEERYLEIHDPSKINVKEGDTQKLIRRLLLDTGTGDHGGDGEC